MAPGQYCTECTLTDLELPSVVALGEGRLHEDAPAYLIESHSNSRFPIVGSKWKIGRDPTNQVVLEADPYTSRFHAWITFEDNHYFVEDLGSTNGTLLNGQPLIRRRPLLSGDHLRIGRSEFKFVVESKTGSSRATRSGSATE